MRRRFSLVLSSLVAVVALACGGWLLDPAGSREPVGLQGRSTHPTTSGTALYKAVTRRMVEARTTTYTFSGSSGGGATQSGSGPLRFLSTGESARTFDADVTMMSPATGQVRAVLLPGVFFLALPPAKGLPRNKPWLKVSESPKTALGRQLRPMAEQMRAAFDPSQSLGLLLAAPRVEVVGRDTVEGVPTTQHRATIDLRTAARLAQNPELRAQYRAMITAGVRTLEYDVWLDTRGLPRRVRADVPASQGLFSITGVYRDWGKPVRITAPTAEQVFDADAIKG
jgi:hypothetical protein